MRTFGLIGRAIGYSFSCGHFAEKFEKEGLQDCRYVNFDLPEIADVCDVLTNPEIAGLNVTIPYKEAIIPYLDELSPTARDIGAVNTIALRNGKTVGYNTDHIGFAESLKPLLKPNHKKALVLGTGGASKAVLYALRQLNIDTTIVSREKGFDKIGYEELTEEVMRDHLLIVNCTPLGTSPDVTAFPPIPYGFLRAEHLAYDLIYNPEKTVFLQKAAEQGASIKNGHEMLVRQAEAAWAIWNS